MKQLFLLCALSFSLAMAQAQEIFGKFTKPDGATITGTSKAVKYERQVEISNAVAGAANSNTLEIDIPAGAAVAEFKTIMNSSTSPGKTLATKPVKATTVRTVPANTKPVLAATLPTVLQKLQRAEITITKRVEGRMEIAYIIFLEDVQVISCQDDINAGTSKIKLKATRYGTKYFTKNNAGQTTTSNSGWDIATNVAWTNF